MSDNPAHERFTERIAKTTHLPAESTPEAIPTVLPVPKPLQPSFWMALLWTLLFLVVTQGAGMVVGVVFFLADVLTQPDPGVHLSGLSELALFRSPEFSCALAWAFLTAQLVSWILSLVVIRAVVGKGWMRQLALRPPSLTHLVLGVLGLPGLWTFAVGLDQVTRRFLPSLVKMEQVVDWFSHWHLGFAIFVIGAGPALGEELWFRGFLGRGLVGRYGVLLGTFLASLLFGIVHLEPRQVVYAPVLGMAFHLVYLATRSFWMPVLLHFLNNTVSITLPSILEDNEHISVGRECTSAWGPLLIFPFAAVLVGVVGYALYKSQVRIGSRGITDGQQPWQPDFPGVECPPSRGSASLWNPSLRLHEWGLVVAGAAAFGLACYFAIALGLLA